MDEQERPHAPETEPAADGLTLAELTAAAGVSPRTVRYYIAEGLLPPPLGQGPKSAYTPAHLDRLRLIKRLQAGYLPLREIRRTLAGLDDAGVRAALAAPEAPDGEAAAPPAPDSAADYVARVLGRLRGPAAPLAAALGQAARGQSPPPRLAEPTASSQPAVASAPFVPPPAPPAEAGNDQGAWRRIRLGEEAELLIREDAYQRRRDRVEWLVEWARKVFR